MLLAGLGQHALAERLVDRQIEIYRQLGQPSSLARGLAHKAVFQARQGQWKAAAARCREALSRLNWQSYRPLALDFRRRLLALLGPFESVLGMRRELARTRRLDLPGQDQWSKIESLRLMGRAEAQARHLRAAEAHLESATTARLDPLRQSLALAQCAAEHFCSTGL